MMGVPGSTIWNRTRADRTSTLATAQIGLAQHLEPYVSDGPNMFSHQHAAMIKGKILLRDDSVIMMSPEMYRAVVAPHDERVLHALGGGVHTCGKAEAHALAFIELPSILCLDLGQPELNDMDALYAQLERRRIPLTRMKVSRDDLDTARIMDRFPTGVTLLYEADSLLDAKETMDTYLRATEKIRTTGTAEQSAAQLQSEGAPSD